MTLLKMEDMSWDHVFNREDNSNSVRLFCATCAAKTEMVMRKHLPPEVVRQKFEQTGWEVDIKRRDRCHCPTCITSRRQRRVGTLTLPNGVTLPSAPQATLAVANPIAIPVPAPAPAPAPVATPAPPTQNQRFRMRQLLEGNFDETGIYLNDYSDQRIADEVGVALADVESVRVAGWGELRRVDPEVEAIRQLLDAARGEHERFQVQMDEIFARLAKLDAK